MRSKREQPELNTSSLPDIVFMILFFFMAIGMFPSPQPKVENDIFVATSGVELEDTNKYIHVRVGPDGVQLGYEIIPLEELSKGIKDFRKKWPKRNIVVLHVDDDVAIGYIKNEVEPAILAAGVKQVRYETIQPEEVSSEEGGTKSAT